MVTKVTINRGGVSCHSLPPGRSRDGQIARSYSERRRGNNHAPLVTICACLSGRSATEILLLQEIYGAKRVSVSSIALKAKEPNKDTTTVRSNQGPFPEEIVTQSQNGKTRRAQQRNGSVDAKSRRHSKRVLSPLEPKHRN